MMQWRRSVLPKRRLTADKREIKDFPKFAKRTSFIRNPLGIILRKDTRMLKEIFKIISFYDKARWNSISNYNLINFYKTDLDDDTKLLTHWLCYISDRQMAFERIWEVGGFIFSELVSNLKESKNIEILKPNQTNSFINGNGKGGYAFTSKSKVGNVGFVKQGSALDIGHNNLYTILKRIIWRMFFGQAFTN